MKFGIRQFLLLACVCLLAFAACSCRMFSDGSSSEQRLEVTCYLTTTAEAPTSVRVIDGKLQLGELPTRVGYAFRGLYDAPEGGSMIVDANGVTLVVVDHAMTLYAQWDAKEYNIVFDTQGGELLTQEFEMAVTYGSTVARFPEATMEGHTFVGWEDAQGNRYSRASSVLREKQSFTAENYTIDGSTVRLYAVYEIAKYSVTFNYNDGTYRTEEIKVEYGQTIPADAYPTEGIDTGSSRVFGWGLSADAVQPYGGTVKSNMTLYAIWKDYKTFTMNDTVGNETGLVVYRGETVDLSTYDGVIRPGYELVGWYTQVTYAGNPVTEIRYESPDKIYYAKWEVATYTLVFDQTSAGKSVSPITYQMGDTFALEIIEREGLTFRGWSVSPDGSGEVFMSLPANFWGNHTLYAVFEPVFFEVSLWSDGGTLPAGKETVSLEYGKTYQLPVPEKDGHVFLGWYDGTEDYASRLTDELGMSAAAYAVAADSVFYAKWEPKKYNVTFNTNGGSEIATIKVSHGDKLAFPADPTKAGMIFEGWYDSSLTDSYGTGFRVTGDVTLYAKWIQSTPISSVADLIAIAANPNANYHLTRNIDLGGAEWTMIPEFNGVLNGKGYSIKNFSISIYAGNGNAGFIGVNNGTIQNLTLSDFAMTVSGEDFRAGVIAGTNNGTVRGCTVTDGAVTFSSGISSEGGTYYGYGGGVVGVNYSLIDGCTVHVDMSVRCDAYNSFDRWFDTFLYYFFEIGGVAGYSGDMVSNSKAQTSITISMDSNIRREVAEAIPRVGGAIGRNNEGEVSNCVSETEITVVSATGNAATVPELGGFVSYNNGTISACSASGIIKDTAGNVTTVRAGGFVYQNHQTINNCYSTVSLDIKSVGNDNSRQGGFAGYNAKTITNCYSTGSINTASNAGKGTFVGKNEPGGSINKCFATGNLTMTTASLSGTFVGEAAGGSSCYKCYYNQNQRIVVNGTGTVPALFVGDPASVDTLQSSSFIFNTLAWNSDIWYIPESGYPVLIGS